jgi:hypothetical protein
MITNLTYNAPLGIQNGYFNQNVVPTFPDYLMNYHLHFMRYLYFLCIMNGEGEYPFEMSIENIQSTFDDCKKKKCNDCTLGIKKILIGEAPPPNPQNYFYNPNSPWTDDGRPGVGGSAFTGAIQTALFGATVFATKLDFLIQCAREGFLLLDLFPYPISFTARTSRSYRNACISAWGAGPTPFPHNIFNILDYLICCIQKRIAFGFALKSFSEVIIANADSVAIFNEWCLENGIILNPPGPLEQIRVLPTLVANASNYIRVCGRNGLYGPCPVLLNSAGF